MTYRDPFTSEVRMVPNIVSIAPVQDGGVVLRFPALMAQRVLYSIQDARRAIYERQFYNLPPFTKMLGGGNPGNG